MPFHSSRHTGNATVGRPTESGETRSEIFSEGEIQRPAQVGSGRKQQARGELRPKWEMDNFSCSHRCLPRGDGGQGRVGAQTPARPVALLGSLLSLLTGALAPIVVRLVFLCRA